MPKARAVEAFIVWMLSIMLAGIFLLAGVPKLIGIETIGLQAAAMHGFPTWIRVLAGLVEVVGAICLLLPRVAWFAALLLAFVMIPATLTQYTSGEPGVYLPIIVFLALVFLAWRRSAKEVNDSYQQFVKTPHPLLYEGVIAGLIGASLIAVWFLFVDSIARRPFYTPEVLGRALVGVLGPSTQEDSAITFVLAYTVFHFSAFMVVGLIASLIVFIARKEPSILFFFLILFVMTEVGVYGLVGLLDVVPPSFLVDVIREKPPRPSSGIRSLPRSSLELSLVHRSRYFPAISRHQPNAQLRRSPGCSTSPPRGVSVSASSDSASSSESVARSCASRSAR